MDNNNYATVLDSYVIISSLQVLDHLVLAKRWGISPEKALNTIHCTTQHGVHTVLHPSLYMQFRTNNHQLWYRRSPHNVNSDTLFATTVSKRGSRCAQIFATNFGWSHFFPMKLKSKPHKVLSLLFKQDRVPSAVIYDNSKEMVLGEFTRKLKELLCHLKQTEPFTPWLNAAKREIKELNKDSGRKLMKSGTPKILWDHCLELESYIRSNIAHGIYKQDGEVLETMMSGKLSNISQFCEFEWFKKVKTKQHCISMTTLD